MDDGGDGVEEAQAFLAGHLEDGVGQGGRGQRAGGDDDVFPFLRRQAGDFLAHDGDQRMSFQLGRHGLRKAVAIDRQGAARRDLMGVAAFHDDRAERAHLGVQQADGVVFPVVRTEGVGADQFGQAIRLVRVGLDARHAAHFMQDDGHAGLGDLPGGFGAGEAAADDVHRGGDGLGSGSCVRHGGLLAVRKASVSLSLRWGGGLPAVWLMTAAKRSSHDHGVFHWRGSGLRFQVDAAPAFAGVGLGRSGGGAVAAVRRGDAAVFRRDFH
ncbi:hypothetical protein D3C85_1071060 [compost metagenome]